MSMKTSLLALTLAVATMGSTNALALDDYCTPKLNDYLEKLQATVDSKYMPSSQKETAQKVLDKVSASRNEEGDCIILEKIL